MPLSLLSWEHEQLLDHLQARPDIWVSPREHMWLRNHSADDDTAVMGLVISPPVRTGPFRQFALRTLTMAWSQEQCDSYLDNLVSKWTDYGIRRRYTSFLTHECELPATKAASIAVALCTIDQGELRTEDDQHDGDMPSHRDLWPDIAGAAPNVVYNERVIRSFALIGGGWLTVRYAGGMLKVRASLRSDGRYGGGFNGTFEGYIRPLDRDISLAAAFLFGNDISYNFTPEQIAYMQQRQKELDYEHPVVVVDGPVSAANTPAESGGAEDIPEPEPGSAVPEL